MAVNDFELITRTRKTGKDFSRRMADRTPRGEVLNRGTRFRPIVIRCCSQLSQCNTHPIPNKMRLFSLKVTLNYGMLNSPPKL